MPAGGSGMGGMGGIKSKLAGFFPEKGSDAQYEMIMQLVQAGLSSAQGSNSPLTALLAPLAGAVIGGGATRKHQDAKAATNNEMAGSILGNMANDPAVQGYIEVLNNPSAPDYLKKVAQSKLDAMVNPKTAKTTAKRSGGGRRSGGGSSGSGQKGSRLYGEYDIGGILHGRDNYGKMVPYVGPDGSPVSATKGKGASAPAGSVSVVDELAALAAPVIPSNETPQPVKPAMDEKDPLGILGLPPA